MGLRTDFVKLQPDYDHTNVYEKVPYPYWINPKNGNVERQDVWKGAPLRLLGFADPDEHFEIAVSWHEWVADPDLGTGLFPVFIHSDGSINTYTHPTRAPEPQHSKETADA